MVWFKYQQVKFTYVLVRIPTSTPNQPWLAYSYILRLESICAEYSQPLPHPVAITTRALTSRCARNPDNSDGFENASIAGKIYNFVVMLTVGRNRGGIGSLPSHKFE
ncbi:hypothetical protein BDR07DRAFT_1414188 [Suillus spraguei]|nr:hypothetical protein BDR07DRAFT_1414188 [Suillus spraguei]